MTGASVFLSLVLVVLVVVGVEVTWKHRRAAEHERQDQQWRDTEQAIRANLADPDRQSLIEDVRLRALSNQASLEHICQATATALGAPAAVITVVEIEGQRWLAYYGADWCGDDIRDGSPAPLETSYCQYVVANDQPLVIADSLNDVRVRTATDQTKHDVRAYIGSPVHAANGVPVGALCVFDTRPRRWSPRDEAVVSSFASLVLL